MQTSEVNYAVFHTFITNIPQTDCMCPVILAQMRRCQIPTVRITCKGLAIICNLFCQYRGSFSDTLIQMIPPHHQLNVEPSLATPICACVLITCRRFVI